MVLLIHGLSFFLCLVASIPSAFGETRSTSLTAIVLPKYTYNGKVVIFRNPRAIPGAETSLSSSNFASGSFTITSSIAPTTAVGVFLWVNAMTDVYFELNTPNDLSTPPTGISANFFEMGDPVGTYPAPGTKMYRENNLFFLPLQSGATHTVEWKLRDVTGDGQTSSFKVLCLGYVE